MASKIKVDQIEGSSGSTITIPTGQTFTVTDGIPVASGGTGLASFTAGDILYATGATTLTKLGKGTAEQVLAMNTGATAPDWGSVDVSVGGTGIASFTAGDILYATGATTLTKLAKGSAADVLTMNSGASAPEWAAAAGGGKLLQVQSTHISAASSITTGAHNSGWSAYGTFMTCAITPAATSSKILVLWQVGYDFGSGYAIHLGRDDANGDVEIGMADAASNRNRALTGAHNYEAHAIKRFAGQYLDSPSIATEITYEMKVSSNSATAGWYLNRSVADRDESVGYDPRGVSNLTVMEIGA